MKQFNCNRTIKIIINQITKIASLTLQYKQYAYPKIMEISEDIKDFIKKNIDLLP